MVLRYFTVVEMSDLKVGLSIGGLDLSLENEFINAAGIALNDRHSP